MLEDPMNNSKNDIPLFSNPENTITKSTRRIFTASHFARTSLFYLQEIGQLRSLRPHTSSRNSFQSYLFFLVLKGTGALHYMEQTYHLTAGSLIFIDCRNQYAHETGKEDPWELIWIHFNGAHIDKYYRYFQEQNRGPVQTPPNTQIFVSLYESLMHMDNRIDSNGELIISLVLHQLLTYLITGTASNGNSQANEKISQVHQYLTTHFYEPILLDSLSKRFYIDKYHMCKEFKRCYGITIIHFLQTLRVKKSMELLRYSNMNIGEIALAVGFENGNYFNKVFQKIEGITAREYRKVWKGKHMEKV